MHVYVHVCVRVCVCVCACVCGTLGWKKYNLCWKVERYPKRPLCPSAYNRWNVNKVEEVETYQKWLVRKSQGTQKQLSLDLRLLCVTNATIFAKENSIKKSVYSYLALLMSPWNIQETWRCESSWACGNSFGAQNSIAFFDPHIRDSQILDCIARLHFWQHNFFAH